MVRLYPSSPFVGVFEEEMRRGRGGGGSFGGSGDIKGLTDGACV